METVLTKEAVTSKLARMVSNERNKLLFSDVVQEKITAKEVTVTEIARVLGKERQSVYRYLETNSWPDHRFGKLCKYLGFAFISRSHACEQYEIGRLSNEKTNNNPQLPRSYNAVMTKMTKISSPRQRASKEIESEILDLIHTMNYLDFWIITTQTMQLAMFSPKRYPTVPDALYAAISRGLLLGFILPTESRIKILKDYHNSPHFIPYQQFQEWFRTFRAGCIDHLRNSGRQSPERECDKKMQLFEEDDPIVQPCDTLSLLGHASAHGACEKRVLQRRPTNSGSGVELMKPNDLHQDTLQKHIEGALNRAMVKLTNGHSSSNKQAANDDRKEFIDTFLRRRLGDYGVCL